MRAAICGDENLFSQAVKAQSILDQADDMVDNHLVAAMEEHQIEIDLRDLDYLENSMPSTSHGGAMPRAIPNKDSGVMK
jgi:hypothetical protein